MAEGIYSKYVMTELKMNQTAEAMAKYSEFATRILWMDEKNTPGAFQMNTSWYLRPPKIQLAGSHHHDAPEIIGFFGSDTQNPHDLGGEIEIWLEDENFILTKSTMIFIPAGMKHCPLIIKRVDKPIFHFTTVKKGEWKMLDQTQMNIPANTNAQYVNQRIPNISCLITISQKEMELDTSMDDWNHLILWIDDKLVPGAFQMNCCWYDKVPTNQPYFQHKHDVPEIIGLFGCDPQHPHNMNAEVEFWMKDEKYIIDRSCMIFVPSGVKHCPLNLKRVDKPIFHFTVVSSPLYSMSK